MRKAISLFMGLLMLSSCKPPPVNLFNVETYLRPYESEKTASVKRKWGDTFKDAAREMCEDLYKTLVSTETNTDKASGK